MSCDCDHNPYSHYGHSTAPCCPTPYPCGPTGPTGPANISGATAISIGYFSTTPATVLATAGFFIPFNVYTANVSPSYLIGTGVYQAPTTGLYLISPTVGYAFTTAGTITTSIMQNGVARLMTSTNSNIAGSESTAFSTVMMLYAGDFIQVQSQTDGVAVATLASGTYPTTGTSLSIIPLSQCN